VVILINVVLYKQFCYFLCTFRDFNFNKMNQDKPIFVGRVNEIRDIKDFISDHDKGIVIIKGHTDMGKTALSEELERHFDNEDGVYCGRHRIEFSNEPVRPLLLVLAELIGQLSKDEKGGGLQLAKDILTHEINWSQGMEVGKAFIKDFASALKLKGTFEKVTDIAGEAVEDESITAKTSGLLAEHKESVRATFIRLLKTISEKSSSDCRFVSIIDQVEYADNVLWEFLVDAARSLPERFFLVLTVNHEKREGQMFLDDHEAELQNLDPYIKELEGLTDDDIKELIKIKRGVRKTPAEIADVRRITGGRPLLLISWIDSEEFDKSVIDERIKKYDGFFKKKLEILSKDANKLAVMLSILPMPMPAGLEDYAMLMDTNLQECQNHIKELVRRGVFKGDWRGCWFDHELIKDYIVDNTHSAIHKQNAEKIMKIITERYPDSLNISKELPLYSVVAHLLSHTENYKNCIDYNLELGKVYFSTSSYVLALESLKKTLIASKKSTDRKNEGTSLNNIGLVYMKWGKYDEAIRYLNEALDMLREVGDRVGEGTSLNNIGEVYRSWGKYDEAIRYLNEALDMLREAGDRAGEGTTLRNIGEVYRAWGKYDEALKKYKESLEIHREVENRAGEGPALNNIGLVYEVWGKYDEAIKYYKESLEIHREVENRFEEGTTLNNIGAVYRLWGKHDEAIKYLNMSLEISREVGNRTGEAITCFNIGCLCFNKKDLINAEKCIESAYNIAVETGMGEIGQIKETLDVVRGAKKMTS